MRKLIITQLFGGLGNQLFQYAAGRRLAHARGVELKVDTAAFSGGSDKRPAGLEQFKREILLFQFNTNASEATIGEIDQVADKHRKVGWSHRFVRKARKLVPGWRFPKTHIREKDYRFDPALLEAPSACYLQGYWQSWKYFADAADVIRAELTPRDPRISAYSREYLDRLKNEHGTVVSLHVRRGDIAHAVEALKRPDLVHGGPVGLDYIHAAIERFPEAGVFLVFSDSDADLDWCQKNIRSDRLTFARGHPPVQDMLLMSACDHHITANSTFSWWAAWIGGRPGKRVVTPRQWSSPGAKVVMYTDDLIPPEWELL